MADDQALFEAIQGLSKKSSDDDLFAQIQSLTPNPNSGQPPKDKMSAREKLDSSLSVGERLLIGTGRGFIDVYEGAKQLGLEAGEFLGMVDPSKVKRFTEAAQAERELYDKGDLGIAGTAGRVGGNIAATAVPGGVVAKGLTAIPKVASIGQAVTATAPGRAAAAGTAGAAGGASVFVGEDDSRLANTAMGAGLGIVGQKALSALSRQIQKIPRTLGRAATRNARRNAAMNNLRGSVPAAELERIADDVADGLTPEQAIRKADIESIGATPTRGRVSGSSGDLAFEVRANRAQEETSGAVANLQGVIQDNKRAILDTADNLVRQFGRAEDVAPGSSGRAAATALSAAKKRTQREVVTPAFDEAGEKLAMFGESVRVQTDSINARMADEIDNLQDPGMAPVRSALREFGLLKKAPGTDDMVMVEGANLNAKQAESLRRRLSKIKGANPGRVAGAIQRALEDDVQRTFGEDIFSAARTTAKEQFFDKFVNRARVDAVIQGKIEPEAIAQKIGSSFSAREADEFFKTLDEVDPGAAQNVRGSVLEGIFSKMRSEAQDVEGLPEINAASLSRQLKQVGDDKLNAIFGREMTGTLKRYANTVTRLTSVDRRAAGPNTANDLINKLKTASGYLMDAVPLGAGRLIMATMRALSRADLDRGTERRARRALNMALLKKENVLEDILSQRVSAGGAAAAGYQAGQATNEADVGSALAAAGVP